ncbi:DUF6340 family protein [Salinivirga cyanobacteriivorans]
MRLSHNIWNKAAIFILSVVLLSGCATLGKVELEVLKPAQSPTMVQLEDIRLQNQFLKFNKKQKTDFENLVKYDKFRIDSLISVELIKAVGNEIQATQVVKLQQIDSLGRYKAPANSGILLKNVDVVSEVETEPIYVNSRGAYYAAVRVPYKIEWTIISNGEAKPFTYQDTVWAEGYKRSFDKLADLVRFNEVIKYIIRKTGVEFAHQLVPHWKLATRYYYRSGNNDFQRAAYFMDNGDYEKAAKIWKQYSQSGNRSIVGNALLNLAVYHELNGDIDQAMEYASQAAEQKNELAVKYLKTLKERKEEIKQLLEE